MNSQVGVAAGGRDGLKTGARSFMSLMMPARLPHESPASLRPLFAKPLTLKLQHSLGFRVWGLDPAAAKPTPRRSQGKIEVAV